MAAAVTAPAPSAPAAPARRLWLFGPASDLLLGCGVAYAGMFLLLALRGPDIRALLPMGIVPLVYLVTSAPHYGATLLRVYERREDRRGYALFAVWATLVLAGLFLWGLASVAVGSLILTVYLTWSPWHYSGQNYGIAVMFLHRRGVALPAPLKRALNATFWLSFALTFLALHGQAPAATYAPQGLSGMVYSLRPLGIPTPVVDVAMNAVAGAYAVVLIGVVVALLRRARLADLTPVLLLLATQALWFSVPAVVRQWGLLQGVDPLATSNAAYAFVWIAVGHSIQYLWITAYYARSSGRAPSLARFYGKALLAGIALWTIPALLFAPGWLGRLPYDAGLGMLVGAMVNLHHFVLDGAIWKLRDSRISRVLIRPAETAPEAAEVAPARRIPLWPGVAAAGLVSVAIVVVAVFEYEEGLRASLARGDLDRAETAIARLARIGRDSPEYHLELARAAVQQGRPRRALDHVEQSLALHETTPAWVAKGEILEGGGRLQDAVAAYQRAIEIDPQAVAAHYRQGVALLRLGQRPEARRALSAAAHLAPRNPAIQKALAETATPDS